MVAKPQYYLHITAPLYVADKSCMAYLTDRIGRYHTCVRWGNRQDIRDFSELLRPAAPTTTNKANLLRPVEE